MKRIGYLFEKICTIENINLADAKARKGKKNRKEIVEHDLRHEDNQKLLESLLNGTYTTSKYKTFKIYEPKERLIYKLPYYPDRIVHHAIMNVMEPIWVNTFIKNTYSCIKGRGIKGAYLAVKHALKDVNNTQYCLKVDVKKFYPSIDHDVLMEKLKKKIKDEKLLNLLHNIVYSTDGVPIGNYLSQFFANIYLTDLDHKIKEEWGVKYYFRYADDMVFLHDNKEDLHLFLNLLKSELSKIKLELKPNYQIYKVDDRGLDFIGFVFYHNKILLRKSIKKRIKKKINLYKLNKVGKIKTIRSLKSYYGWLKLCNSVNLRQIIEDEVDIGVYREKPPLKKSLEYYKYYRYKILRRIQRQKKLKNKKHYEKAL